MSHSLAWYYANRERALKRMREYQKSHPEAVKAASRRQYEKNKPSRLAYAMNRLARKASIFRDGYRGRL